MSATRIGMSSEVTHEVLIRHLKEAPHALPDSFIYGLLSSPDTAPYSGTKCAHGNFLIRCIACKEVVLFGFPRGGKDSVCPCVD